MKILFVITQSFNPNDGGVQRTTYKLGKFFSEKGLDVSYFSFKSGGHVQSLYGKLFTALEPGGCAKSENLNTLRGIIREVRPNVVINQAPYEVPLREVLAEEKVKYQYKLLACLRNSLFSFKSNAREITAHSLPKYLFKMVDNRVGLGAVQMFHWMKHRKELRSILDLHDFFILLAPPNEQELQYFVGGYKADKVIAIPNSIEGVLEGPLEKRKAILHVGRLNIQQKRSDLLLRFWQLVHPELKDWDFIVVGDGPYLSTLKQQIDKEKIPRVRLEGYQKPEGYYANAAIFMMPSAYEGFPNTILEAQSAGCVPLAFNSYAALSWIVNNGKDALLSHPFDVQEMANHAIGLASDHEKLGRMRSAAIENSRRFTIDVVGKIWLQFFDKITK